MEENVYNMTATMLQEYCYHGCATGVDLKVCSLPGKDDLGGVAYASKSYVNTSEWDNIVVE